MNHRRSLLNEARLREAKEMCERGYIWSTRWNMFVPMKTKEEQARVNMGMAPDRPLSLKNFLRTCVPSRYK